MPPAAICTGRAAASALTLAAPVYSGGDGATLDQVRAVCCDDLVPAGQILDLLAALIDGSLLTAVPVASAMRYQLLGTIRQYGLEHLAQAGLLDQLRARQLREFTGQADRYDDGRIVLTPDLVARIDADYPNLLAAFETGCERGGTAPMRICVPPANYWIERGLQSEGADLLRRALKVAPDEPSALRSMTLSGLALMRIHQGDFAAALRLGEEAAAVGAEAGDGRAEALGLMRLGLCLGLGEPRKGTPLIRRAIELLIIADHPVTLSFARYCLVEVLAQSDDWTALRPALDACLSTASDLGHRTVVSWCLIHQGHRAELDCDVAALRAYGDRVVRGQNDPLIRSLGTTTIAQAYALAGETAAARELVRAGLEQLGDEPALASTMMLTALAGVELAAGDTAAARRACPDYRAPQGAWWVIWAAHTLLRSALAEEDTGTARANRIPIASACKYYRFAEEIPAHRDFFRIGINSLIAAPVHITPMPARR